MGARQPLLSAGHTRVWVLPAIAAVAFGVITFALVRRTGGKTRRETGEQFLQLALIWLMVFDASWLVGAGLWWQAATIVTVLLASLLIPKWNQLARHPKGGGSTEMWG